MQNKCQTNDKQMPNNVNKQTRQTNAIQMPNKCQTNARQMPNKFQTIYQTNEKQYTK